MTKYVAGQNDIKRVYLINQHYAFGRSVC